MHKMSGDVVVFPNPIPKVYEVLPLTKPELDDVLAFVYVGPTNPIPKDLKCRPLLIRKKKITIPFIGSVFDPAFLSVFSSVENL